eukprot:TRINITY_DN1823_c0_g1_i1.p1 TRINITY_DN1823_c0_g1~~TRINITY_DN1823_c0_g1_i1.p1  ORF type:complete len:809 (+),score=209.28 TRINITY_DN1823_c0_g1_i1:57-2483(+)
MDYHDEHADHDAYIIEKILKKRTKKADNFNPIPVSEYFVKWAGYGDDYNEWKSVDELYDLVGNDFKKHLEDYENTQKIKNRAKKYKGPAEKEKEESKWSEALGKLEQSSKKEREIQRERMRIAREEEQIQRELAAEARRIADEAERREREEELLKAAERRKIVEMRKKRQEAKRDIITVEFYKALEKKKPQTEMKTVPPPAKKMRSRVPTLWNICIAFICKNLELYDGWEHVPVIWKAKMFHYMSMNDMLSPKKFKALLDPVQKYLDLSICRNSVNESFFKAFKKSPFLTALTLTDCPKIYFNYFKYFQECPMLEKLVLSGCIDISSLQGLEKCKNLKELNISGCSQMCVANTTAIDALFQLTNLSLLDLSNLKYIPAMKLLELLQKLPNLTRLNADNSGDIPNQKNTLASLGISDPVVCKNLLSLKWKLPKKFHSIEGLQYYNEIISFILISQRHNLPLLEELSLTVPHNNTALINEHPNLKHLSIEILVSSEDYEIAHFNSNRYYSMDEIITNRDKLCTIDIGLPLMANRLYSHINARSCFTDKMLRTFVSSPLSNLQVLKLNGMVNGSLYGLILLWRNDSLRVRELDISGWGSKNPNKNWLDWTHLEIPALKFAVKDQLVKLCVSKCYWFDPLEAIQALISPQIMPNLEELDFSDTNEDNRKVLSYLTQNFPSLASLCISYPPYFSDDPSIPDASMIRNLRIRFHGPQPSFQWNKLLSNFSGLRSLYVEPSSNSTIGLNNLLASIRDCGRWIKVAHVAHTYLPSDTVEKCLKGARSLELLKVSSAYTRTVSDGKFSFQVVPVDDS